MAPNLVKSASMCSIASLDMSNHLAATYSESVASAFPPLTDISTLIPPKGWNQEASARKDPVFGANKMTRTSSRIFKFIVEEEAQKAVSCAYIETNLIADSNCKEDNDQFYCENSNDYDESYWDMPASDCDHAIEDKVLSSGQVEKLLVEDALRRIEETKQQRPMVEDHHPNNAYWDWSSEPVLESERKSNLIASIILEESIRQRLSIDSITDLETSNKSNSNDLTAPQIESTSSAQVSVDYWCWNAEEEKVDTEEIVAPHVHDPTHPNHAYWDFPTESKDPQALKEKLIDTILKEERIRNLLQAEIVEEREVNFHRSRQGQPKTKYNYAPAHVLESMPLNYWDFDNTDPGNLLSLLSKEKQEVINRILKEERQRYLVSTENIENNLRRESEKAVEDVNGSSSSSDYWQW